MMPSFSLHLIVLAFLQYLPPMSSGSPIFEYFPRGVWADHYQTVHAAPAQSAIRCPLALPPGSAAPEGVLAAVRAAMPRLYPGVDHKEYRVTLLTSLQPGMYQALNADNQILRQIAVHQCGTTVANRSWLVFIVFPRLRWSASMYSGQLFLARTRAGWRVWFQFH